MANILALDLGTNSIGWSIVNPEKQEILDLGVRIFEEGVNKLGQGEREMSKNASRTQNRQLRRQLFRKKLRRRLLLKLLRVNGMAPVDDPEQMKDWYKINPYEVRAKAIAGRVELLELGRAFFQICKRRGFLSNSRSANANPDSNKLYKTADGKIGITDTDAAIGDSTLGAYLYSILPKEGDSYQGGMPRVRSRYTTRQMYINEFERIWTTQAPFHANLTDHLKARIGGRQRDGYSQDGVLFFVRPLRSQKHRIGKCTFELNKPRCPVSAIPFELFRACSYANTIECNGEKLSLSDRDKVVELLCAKEKVVFKDIRKKLLKTDGYYAFNYQDDDTVQGCFTLSTLSKYAFWARSWQNLSEKEQEDIWHVLFAFDDREKLYQHARRVWLMDENAAQKISRVFLKQGYAALSRKAINNILPFLKAGYRYDEAVVLGGVRNAFGERWREMSAGEQQLVVDTVLNMMGTGKRGGFIDDVRLFLTSQYGMGDKALAKLYHHSAKIHQEEVVKKLPVNAEADRQINSIKNPIVVQALFELRRLVNCLVDRYGAFSQIKIELARDLKISKKQREQIRSDQKRNETNHGRIAEVLRTHQIEPSWDNITRYKLWEECQHTCPYTGEPIALHQLFNGEIDIEHIIPYSRSLDDSFLNLTLCFAWFNREEKKNATPYEYFSKRGDWEAIKARVLRLFFDTREFPHRYKKFKRFAQEKIDEGFIARQLVDTRYISVEARHYLGKICPNVTVSPGMLTAKLRVLWGLNSLIDNGTDQKDRTDHRHHAIDALVLACTTQSYVQMAALRNRYHRSFELERFPLPWDSFRLDAARLLGVMLVSYRKPNKVVTIRNVKTEKHGKIYVNKGIAARGPLHKEYSYGRRQAPGALEPGYYKREPIEVGITDEKDLQKVADPALRNQILKHLSEKCGVDITQKQYKVPKDAFFTIENGRKIPRFFLPNINGGKPVPVFTVRKHEEMGRAMQVGETNRWVNPRNNHHVLIYEDERGRKKEQVVPFWEVVERYLQKQSLFQLPPEGLRIVATLEKEELFLLKIEDTEIDWNNPNPKQFFRHLYRLQKISESNYVFVHHASIVHEVDKYKFDDTTEDFPKVLRRSVGSLKGIKVIALPDGRIKKEYVIK